MELWIRSQDKKRLIKADGLIEHLNEIWMYEPKENYSLVVGTYDTKERALEVLDDIQWELSKRELGQPNFTGIYEMPKD